MNPLRGITYKVFSVLLFVLMFSCIKRTAPHVPFGEAVFFRSALALVPILLWIGARGWFAAALKTDNRIGHFWRGLVGVSAMALGFVAVSLLPLPEAIAIGYLAPLLVTIFAAMFLGEQIRIYRLAAIGVGLLGVAIVLAPRLTMIGADQTTPAQTIGAMAALLAAVFAALAQVFVRKLVATETTAAIVFWFSVNAALLSLFTLPWGWVIPSGNELMLLVAAGLLGGVGQIFLTESYRHAEIVVIAPFEYSSMLFSILIGIMVFDELPDRHVLSGAALVISAGLFIVWREYRLGLERAHARAAAPTQS